ncbi:MAG TPA: 2-dehydropantoate 2-reductase [Acidimicrobiales bacterium]|nr:2-dehydropantoate 2-reductase [Acidimicrobiales bacterium]
MKYVIFGAGAIGGGIGGSLGRAGKDVVLVARGAHLSALQSGGLDLRQPDGTSDKLDIPAVGPVADAGLEPGDVVILAMKSQHTNAALEDLEGTGQPDIVVVCAQNGVDNERQALRRFGRVYGMCVQMPASHLEPGVVQLGAAPIHGVLDLGRYPEGRDQTAEEVAADLQAAGFASVAHPAIMTRKYRKLLGNLGNSLDAAAGRAGRQSRLLATARAEAQACFAAAGIAVSSAEEDAERRRPLEGGITAGDRGGSSSWQSLARGSGSIEADYLNGEIVLLGRLHGVPTPVNEFLARLANSLARQGAAPASMSLEEVEAAAAAAGIAA